MVRQQQGFTLIGLMVLIALVNIGLAVAVTSWVTIDKRAKEAELIWRGRQYVRALQCHREQTGGLPDELDDLLESDCIRALYPDPMTRDGNWRVIRESEARGQAGFGGSGGASSVLDDIEREVRGPEAFFGGSGASSTGFPSSLGAPSGSGGGGSSESLRTAYDRLRNITERLRQDFATSGDGIVGVVSRSTDEALRAYDGEATYDKWRFVAR